MKMIIKSILAIGLFATAGSLKAQNYRDSVSTSIQRTNSQLHQTRMATLDAQLVAQGIDHQTRMAELDAQLTAQEISQAIREQTRAIEATAAEKAEIAIKLDAPNCTSGFSAITDDQIDDMVKARKEAGLAEIPVSEIEIMRKINRELLTGQAELEVRKAIALKSRSE
jgi:hypothetical protein